MYVRLKATKVMCLKLKRTKSVPQDQQDSIETQKAEATGELGLEARGRSTQKAIGTKEVCTNKILH